MKKTFATLAAMLALAALLLGIPLSARAAVGISSVSPGFVAANTSTALTIRGVEFVSGSLASLEGFGNLSTTFIDSTTLSAIVPNGVPPGTYTLRVTNPDSTFAQLFNAVTVATAVTPAATATSRPSGEVNRPIIVIDSYKTGKDLIVPGDTFNLQLRVLNKGTQFARNIILSFTVGDLVPQETGGVLAVNELEPGEDRKLTQPLTAKWDLAGQTITTQTIAVSYTDSDGNAYSETFSVAINLKQVYSGVAPTPTPTATPLALKRPQLVITGYGTDAQKLQPGGNFKLNLNVVNLGNANARRVSLIVGGGSIDTDPGGTPGPGGISGSDADLSKFAPLGSSNVQYLGDIDIDQQVEASQDLIVNVTTEPGAYPLKLSFISSDELGNRFIDDQVVTLLVYSVPVLDLNFYRDPGIMFTGMPNALPIQVVNLGKKSIVLGNMRATSTFGDMTNNVILVGSLEPGGYFTLDATLMPFAAGPADLTISVDYTDDFNQPQTFSKTITVEVIEQEIIEPIPGGPEGQPGVGPDGGPIVEQPAENLWQRFVRFLRGLFGLDSAPAPTEEVLPPFEELPPVDGGAVISPGG